MKNKKVIFYSLSFIGVFSCGFVMSMQQEQIDPKLIAEFCCRSIDKKKINTFERYINTYPELINLEFKYNNKNTTLLAYAAKQNSTQHIELLLEKDCCTNGLGGEGPVLSTIIEESCRESLSDDVVRIFLGSGVLCKRWCKHNQHLKKDDEQNKTACDYVLHKMSSYHMKDNFVPFILASSETKEVFLRRYIEIESRFAHYLSPSSLPSEDLVHALVLGFPEKSHNASEVKMLFMCTALVDDFKRLIHDLDTKFLAEVLQEDVFESVLRARNKKGLQVLLNRLDLLNPDEATSTMLENFNAALKKHAVMCPLFVYKILEEWDQEFSLQKNAEK